MRRYRFAPGDLDAFALWWRERLVPVRTAAGFEIELAYAVPSADEFVWAVSVSGDATVFAETEHRYLLSAQRADAFAAHPPIAVERHVVFVRDLLR